MSADPEQPHHHGTGAVAAGRTRAAPFLSGALHLGFGSALATVVAGLTTILVAARLSPADWGIVATSASYALGVATLVLFGLPQLATREIAAGRMTAHETWQATMTCSLFAAPLTFLLLMAVKIPLPLSLLAALLSIIIAVRSGAAAPLVAAGRFRWLGMASLAERVVALAVAALVLWLGDPLLALVAAQCVGMGLVAIRQVAVVQLGRFRLWSLRRLYASHRQHVAFGAYALLFSIAQFDIVLVYLLAGEQESGYFGVASRLVLPLGLIGTVISTVLLPRVATTGGLRLPRRLALLLGLAVAGALILGTLLLETTLVPLLGEAYEPAVRVCIVYLIAVMLVLVNQPLVAVAQACGLERAAAILLAASEVIHLGGAALGAVYFGAFGAAFGYLAGNVLLLACLIVVLVFRERRITWA